MGEVLRCLVTDPEALTWSLIMMLKEVTFISQFNDVNTLFLRDHMHLDPTGMARFISINSITGIVGAGISGPLVSLLGGAMQFSLSNLGFVLGFFFWGRARTWPQFLLMVPFYTLSHGALQGPYTGLLRRANELWLGAGLTMGAMQTATAVVRIIVPRLFIGLYQRSPPLPPGIVFYVIAGLGAVMELLHRIALGIRAVRGTPEGGVAAQEPGRKESERNAAAVPNGGPVAAKKADRAGFLIAGYMVLVTVFLVFRHARGGVGP